MSRFKEAIRSGMGEYLDKLEEALDGLTAAETRWQASTEANHIDWLVWHMARVEDSWMNAVMGDGEQVWLAGGWARRTGITAKGSGYGQTIDEVRALPVVPMAELMGYFAAVRERSFEVLDRLEESALDRRVEHPGIKDITGRWVLGHVLVEESQHLGQVAFIRGLIRGLDG